MAAKEASKLPADMDCGQAIKDIFRPNKYKIDTRFVIRDGKQHKCAILVPGGGYTLVCSFIEGAPIAKKLNALGISAVIVYYRTKKKALYPNPQEDLARGIHEVLDHAEEWNLDMSDYSVWGASAGGHLAASFGTDNMGYANYDLPKPGAMILSYPVISMQKDYTHKDTHNQQLGENADEEAENFASIHLHVTKDYPPTFLWCGDHDQLVSPENTKMMDRALEAAGIPHHTTVYPGVDHGIGPGTGTAAEGWIKEAVKFWTSLH